jgi:hypothetical protein
MSSLSDLHAEGVTDLRAYNIGRDDERESIIKLFEAAHYENTWEHYPEKWVYMENCMACNALWLIRGKNK